MEGRSIRRRRLHERATHCYHAVIRGWRGVPYGEDAYIWRDSLGDGGAFHMLFQGGSYAPQYPQYVGHWHTAFSPDGFNWTVASDSMVFDGNIAIKNGAPSLATGRRERHQILFTDGLPSHLFNGAQLANATSDSTFTSVQPIVTTQ